MRGEEGERPDMKFQDRSLAPYQGSEPYLFLSYSHKDSEWAVKFIRTVKEAGYRIWYDEGVTPGAEWDEHIAHAIENCGYYIALVSQNFLESSNCLDELKFARDLNKPFLLLYLEDVRLPAGLYMRIGRMQALHWYKYEKEDYFFSKVFGADNIENCKGLPPEPPKEEKKEKKQK